MGPEFINSFLQEMKIELRFEIEEGRKEVLTWQIAKY